MAIRQPARLLLALLTLVLATVTLGGVTAAASAGVRPAVGSPAPYPPLVATSSATPDRLSLGDCTDFTGDGFAPASPISLTDNGTSFGSVVSDAGGAFRLRRCFDGAAPCGAHELVAQGQRPDSSLLSDTALVTMICVVQKAPPGSGALGGKPGSTPFSWDGLLLAAVIAAATAILFVLWRAFLARRRKESEPS